MRLIVVTDCLPFGLGESFLLPELCRLGALGCEITLAPVLPPGRSTHPSAEAYVESAGVLDPRYKPMRFTTAATIRRLTIAARALPDAGVPALTRGALLADLVERVDAQHVHAAWASGPAGAAAVASRLTGVPWSFSAHRHDIFDSPSSPRLLGTAAFGRFISRAGLEAARQMWPEIPRTTEVVHLGIDIPDPVPFPRGDGALRSASLIELKDHETLLKAFALVRTEGTLFLAGDGPLRSSLEALAASTSAADRIEFLGHVRHGDLLALMDSGRIAVSTQTSRVEGISVSLMEAMGRGIPVVATNVGGTRELIDSGTGLLTEPGDVAGTASALQRILDDRRFAQDLGAAARDHVSRKFNAQLTGQRLFDLISASTP